MDEWGAPRHARAVSRLKVVKVYGILRLCLCFEGGKVEYSAAVATPAPVSQGTHMLSHRVALGSELY